MESVLTFFEADSQIGFDPAAPDVVLSSLLSDDLCIASSFVSIRLLSSSSSWERLQESRSIFEPDGMLGW